MEKMPTTLKSTTGKHCHGTFSYMCPNVLIHKQPWSDPSDMFPVGCVLYELYLRQYVWPTVKYSKLNNDYLDELEHIFMNNILPDCSDLPKKLQQPILDCFSYDLKERKSAIQMIDAIRSDQE